MTLHHFLKIHNCTENCVVTSTYDIIMSPEHFEIKNKDLHPLKRLKIDCYQLCLKKLTVVEFGSEW